MDLHSCLWCKPGGVPLSASTQSKPMRQQQTSTKTLLYSIYSCKWQGGLDEKNSFYMSNYQHIDWPFYPKIDWWPCGGFHPLPLHPPPHTHTGINKLVAVLGWSVLHVQPSGTQTKDLCDYDATKSCFWLCGTQLNIFWDFQCSDRSKGDASPSRSNSFNFMQFLGNFDKIVCWPPPGSWRPLLGEILDPPLQCSVQSDFMCFKLTSQKMIFSPHIIKIPKIFSKKKNFKPIRYC